MVREAGELSYDGYLDLERILSAQRPRSQPESHDEVQFIIVHQVFELWFKLLLHEAEAVIAHLAADRTLEAERLVGRMRSIVRCFLPALEVLETMVPSHFLEFRDLLQPASGFQSCQFRELEYVCGLRDERYLRVFDGRPDLQERLRARLTAPSVWDAFVAHLERLRFRTDGEASQRRAIVSIYRDERHYELRALCEALIAFDEDFALFRQHHVKMAERMIGLKPGTGKKAATYSLGSPGEALGKPGPMGTHGVEYLKFTLDKKFFPVLWAARTEM